jgi:hypothetical protein
MGPHPPHDCLAMKMVTALETKCKNFQHMVWLNPKNQNRKLDTG